MSHRLCRRAVELLLVAGALASAPWTGRAAAAGEEDARSLQLEVYINDATTHLIGSFIQLDNGRMAARRAELTELGIRVPGPAGANDLVVIDDVAGMGYRYEEPAQRIFFDLGDQLRVTQNFDLRGTLSATAPAQADYGCVLNYDLFLASQMSSDNHRLTFSGANASLDGRVFGPYGTLSQSAILGTTAPTQRFDTLRLDTTWSYSDPETLTTYRVGDTIAGGLSWTRPIRLGGLQVQRNFGLRPDLVTFPLPATSGSAAVPSTLEVYVDNVLTHSQELLPGPYQIDNIPVLSGAGTARVIVRDAAGHQTETDLPFYTSPSLLKQGLYDFSIEAGLPRLRYGTYSSAYFDNPVVSATLRGGLYDWLSLEAHAEGGNSLLNAGLGAVTGLGSLGVVSVAGTASRAGDASGFQSYFAYDMQIMAINFHASSQRTFGSYSDLGSLTAEAISPSNPNPVPTVGGTNPSRFLTNARPPRELDTVSMGVPLPFDSSRLDFGYLHQRLDDGTRSDIASVSYSRPIFDAGSLYLTAFSDVDDHNNYGLFLGLSMPLAGDGSTWASTGLSTTRDGTSLTTDLGRSIQPEVGSYGWRVHDSEGSSPVRSAAASFRSSFAQFDGAIEQSSHNLSIALQADGAIATLGDGTFFSNRIDDAFAVVDAGAPGVHVLQENRPAGITNEQGLLLIPNLRSYERNSISIDARDLPLNADAPTARDVVAPQDRSGVLVDFAVKTDVKAAVVILRDQAGKFIASGTLGRLEETHQPFIIGYDGRAFIEGLQAVNTIVVADAGGECRATFPFASDDSVQVVIGPLTCK